MVGFCQTKKIEEVVVLRNLASNENDQAQFEDTLANTNRKKATIIHNEEVKNRVIRIEKILADKTLFFRSKKSKLM
jgi:hypothetical protein